MSVAKVIEITASSSKGFEDAIEQGISKASKTIDGIRGAWISEQKVRIGDDGEIEEYRVYMRLTFVLED
jgi:flavin-binding protein dodecin